MKRTILIITAALTVLLSTQVFANSAPVVSNVSASQRGDDSKLVDIYYNLADADGDICTVWVVASGDGGTTWAIPVLTISGHVGVGITPGTNKHIVWDAGADMPDKTRSFKARVLADDGKSPEPMVMVGAGSFPYQNGSPVHCDAFMIDKYEVKVSLYCQFLNQDDPAGDHWHSGQEITKHGDPGSHTYTPVPGRENYPVRYVSYYDAVAFAQWRSNLEGKSYRLPTEQEWEKAAGWDPVQQYHYTFGYHSNTASCTYMNYYNCVGRPTVVGSYDPYKSYYGCYDMSGNLWEWTSSIYSGESRVLRGGYWYYNAAYCSVTYRGYRFTPSFRNDSIGFRLVLDLDSLRSR